MNKRTEALYAWVKHIINDDIVRIAPLAFDAGTRRYFRVTTLRRTYVAVDAPPSFEKVHEFVQLAAIFKRAGVVVPEVLFSDEERGFLIVTDFGDKLLLSALTPMNADHYYKMAMHILMPIHASCEARIVNTNRLGGAFFRQELEQFVEWYVEKHCQITVDAELRAMFDKVFTQLTQSADSQAQVCCHRDYHSRNLMVLADDRLGVIDFQDAMMGPITYDIASLLRDCYRAWPAEQVTAWVRVFYNAVCDAHVIHGITFETFMQGFDWVGMQRHMKAIATFARKAHRDHDENYLGYIPQALTYLRDVSILYPVFEEFTAFITEHVLEVV